MCYTDRVEKRIGERFAFIHNVPKGVLGVPFAIFKVGSQQPYTGSMGAELTHL